MNTHSKLFRTAIAATLLATATAGWAAGVGLVRVPGNAPNMHGARYMNAHSPTSAMAFTVALTPRDRDGLAAAVHAMQDPNSPQYRHFMTHDQIVAAYGPTQATVNTVTAYLKGQGIKVTSVSRDRLLIHATATTATVQRAFGVNIADYSIKGQSETVFAPDSDPRMPAGIAGVVTAVMGLDNVVQLQQHSSTIAGGAGPVGYSPQQLATHYKWPSLTDTSQASGVTIGIATAFTYRDTDLNKFWDTYGLPRHTVVSVPVDGVTRRLNDETTLDIEHSGAMAPGAKIVVYSGVNPQFTTFVDVFSAIFNDSVNQPDVISTSWGSCEPNNAPASVGAEETIVLEMLGIGQTIFAAAGDGGAQDRCTGPAGTPSGLGFGGILTISATDNADYPSSAPGVGAAGGTSWDSNAGTETTWHDSGAGGGADSVLFAEPAYETGTAGWVSNASCFEDTNADSFAIPSSESCGAAGNASRQSSDLAMTADFNLTLFYNGRWLGGFGGTSFVAPELAGLWAIVVNQYRIHNSNPTARLGSFGATLYPDVATCSNIVTDIAAGNGNNGIAGTFDTENGWDHPTGWGIPNGNNMISFISNGVCQP